MIALHNEASRVRAPLLSTLAVLGIGGVLLAPEMQLVAKLVFMVFALATWTILHFCVRFLWPVVSWSAMTRGEWPLYFCLAAFYMGLTWAALMIATAVQVLIEDGPSSIVLAMLPFAVAFGAGLSSGAYRMLTDLRTATEDPQ